MSRRRLTATVGIVTGADQLPTIAAFPELSTVTVMGAALALRPAESNTVADSACAPAVAVVVFHVREYGGAVTREPRLPPSSRNCTPVMAEPMSEAVAETVELAVTVAFGAGDVMLTFGPVTLAWDLNVAMTAPQVPLAWVNVAATLPANVWI